MFLSYNLGDSEEEVVEARQIGDSSSMTTTNAQQPFIVQRNECSDHSPD